MTPATGSMDYDKPEPDETGDEFKDMAAHIWGAGAALEDAAFIARMLWRNGFRVTPAAPQQAKAQFEKQRFGATVAQIHATDYEATEVQARNDGKFVLTVHNRTGEPDRWEDLSVTLEPKHFEMLGSIANQRPMSEKPSDISDIFGPKVEPPSEKPIRGIDTDNGGF